MQIKLHIGHIAGALMTCPVLGFTPHRSINKRLRENENANTLTC